MTHPHTYLLGKPPGDKIKALAGRIDNEYLCIGHLPHGDSLLSRSGRVRDAFACVGGEPTFDLEERLKVGGVFI